MPEAKYKRGQYLVSKVSGNILLIKGRGKTKLVDKIRYRCYNIAMPWKKYVFAEITIDLAFNVYSTLEAAKFAQLMYADKD